MIATSTSNNLGDVQLVSSSSAVVENDKNSVDTEETVNQQNIVENNSSTFNYNCKNHL